MNTYYSRSSVFVKMATIGMLVSVIMIAFILITSNKYYGLIGGIILSLLIFGLVIYFYVNSLNKIIVEKDFILLKKNIGQIKIPMSDIFEVSRLGYSNLTMTYGSKGVFGYIGNTMDNSISFVKDRKNMIWIKTKNKKYILSSDKSDELVRELETLYHHI